MTEQRVVLRRVPLKDDTSVSGLTLVPEIAVLNYDYLDTGAGLKLLVDATAAYPIYIRKVVHVVRTAFASLSSATINIGDGSVADYWIDTADIDNSTENFVVSSIESDTAGGGSGSNATRLSGTYYTTTAQILVTLGGTPTAGAGTVIAHYTRINPTV
jgi:hypothetical protein